LAATSTKKAEVKKTLPVPGVESERKKETEDADKESENQEKKMKGIGCVPLRARNIKKKETSQRRNKGPPLNKSYE